MAENRMIRVGITQGDVNGIGPEVIIKTLADPRMSELFVPVVYGSSKVFSYYRKGLPEGETFSFQITGSAREARPKRVNLVETGTGEVRIEPGTATREGGAEAVNALRRAADDLAAGDIDVVVKALCLHVSHDCNLRCRYCFASTGDFGTGHRMTMDFETAKRAIDWVVQKSGKRRNIEVDFFGGEPLMVMCSERMKVGLVTIHVPLAQVSGMLSTELIVRRLEQLRRMLVTDFRVVEPRIAVLGLNPHAGDGGVIGSEEEEMVRPAVAEAVRRGILAFGPFAADGFFASGSYTKYDAVLAMYHDQGLIPFKSLSRSGVNFTASLPVVRTSPDHGVAYDIAGKGVADEGSMRDAVYAAMDIFRSRRWYGEISANPLRHYERERGADVSVKDLKLPEQQDD